MTDVVTGAAFIELRARGTFLGADIKNAVEKAVPTGTSAATKSLSSEVKGLTQQFSGLFGQSALTSTAMQGFKTAEVGAAAGASALATPLVVAGAAVVGLTAAATAAVSEFRSFGAAVLQVQRVTNASAEDASAFAAVFERFGVSVEGGSRSLAFLARNADKNKDSLKALGVTLAANADGSLNLVESFKRVADAVQSATDPAVRFQIIQQTLGRQGLALLPVLTQGADGFDDLAKKAAAAGLTMNQEGVERFKQLRDASKDLGESFAGLKVRLGGELAPAFTALAKIAIPVFTEIGKAVDSSLRGFVGLGLVIADPSRILHLDKLGKSIDQALGKIGDTKAVTDSASAGLEDYAGSVDDADKALTDFVSVEVSAIHAHLDAQQAALSFRDAQDRVTSTQQRYNELLRRSGDVARDFAAAQREIGKSSFDVEQRQRDLNIAIIEAGVNSNRAAKAREALAEATDSHSDAEQKLADLNATTGPRGTETLRVARELESARLSERQAAEAAIEANVKEKETAEQASGATVTAKEHADNLRDAFAAFSQSLAPGSDLRKNIEDTGKALRDVIPTPAEVADRSDAFARAVAGGTAPSIGSAPAAATGSTTSTRQGSGTFRAGGSFGPTVSIINNFSQPIDTSQAAALNQQQAAAIGGGSTRSLFS